MLSASSIIFILLTYAPGKGVSFPLLWAQNLHPGNSSSSTSYVLPNSEPARLSSLSLKLQLGHDIEDLIFPIPGTHPPLYLQMSYDKDKPVDAAPFREVVSIIAAQAQDHITRHGDGPLQPSPWTYHAPGCFSSTANISERGPKMMTFGMLKDVMFSFRVILEGRWSFYEVFYDLMDEHNTPLGEGSLLLEEEPPYRLDALLSDGEAQILRY